MRILITNTWLMHQGGTELIVRDLALAWHRRGDQVLVFSPRLGPLSDEIASHGIEVVDDLTRLSTIPDIIHGHHHLETMMAIQYFPETPALFHCHGYQPWQEAPPVHPRIYLYLTISDRTAQFVHEQTGTPIEDIRRAYNYADRARFKSNRLHAPTALRRAVIYDRYLNADETSVIVSACAAHGIQCDTFADLQPPVVHPETVLPTYDLVFAVGKSALEAIACGAAVILCTGNACGALVTGTNVGYWQKRNFTAITDQIAVTSERISNELSLYDAGEVDRAAAFVQAHASLECFMETIDQAHAEVLARAARSQRPARAPGTAG